MLPWWCGSCGRLAVDESAKGSPPLGRDNEVTRATFLPVACISRVGSGKIPAYLSVDSR